jgi:hypothetical protein
MPRVAPVTIAARPAKGFDSLVKINVLRSTKLTREDNRADAACGS